MQIPKEKSEVINRRKADNTMTKRKRTWTNNYTKTLQTPPPPPKDRVILITGDERMCSGAPEVKPVFCWVRYARSLALCVMFCKSL